MRAEPGGAVTITFTRGGLTIDPEPLGARIERRAGWLGRAPGVFLFVGLAVAAGAIFSALNSHHAPAALQDAALAVALASLACLVLIWLYAVADEVLGYVVFALIVILLPLLLIRDIRRWAGRRLRGDPTPEPERPDRWVSPERLGGVHVERQGRTVAVRVSYLSGEQVRYLARGQAGKRLAAEFEKLCRVGEPQP